MVRNRDQSPMTQRVRITAGYGHPFTGADACRRALFRGQAPLSGRIVDGGQALVYPLIPLRSCFSGLMVIDLR